MLMTHVTMACAAAIFFVAAEIPLATADDVIMEKRQADVTDMDRLLDPKRKRPFCNAFTGCGRKRSDDALSLSTLLEMNSEPAVAELSRQILSEAKLWEAIQEARQELIRRRQLQNNRLSEGPIPLPLATGFRRRREATTEEQVSQPLRR